MIPLTKSDRKSFFTEKEDCVLLTKSGEQASKGGHNKIDYGLTLYTAKKIAVSEQDGQRLIDARELHKKLESKRDFSNWIKTKVTNNPFFEENRDWLKLSNPLNDRFTNIVEPENQKHSGNGMKVKIDYGLTIDTAKKIAMSEQTDIGNKVRDYFLSMEKKALQIGIPQNFAEALRLAAQQQEEIEAKESLSEI
jgi:phage anti-repressor protein